jgi:uncharacterized protein YigA (DUF484 family)
MALADVTENSKLLNIKEKAVVKDNLEALLAKKSYVDTFSKADEQQFEQYRPLVKFSKPPEQAIASEEEQSFKESERRNAVKESQKNIEEVQAEMAKIKVDNYRNNFGGSTTGEVVVLAEVQLDELTNENEKIEQERKALAESEVKKYKGFMQDVRELQEDSKREQLHRGELLRKQLIRAEESSIEMTSLKKRAIDKAFTRVDKSLSGMLKGQRRQIVGKYKDLLVLYKSQRHNLSAQTAKGGASSEWLNTPQIVQTRIEVIRCVKDKLPKGRYAILCSILDRIGGNVLDYQSKSSKKWRRITSPKTHSGEHHLGNIRFEESLLIMAPSRSEVKPSMAYLFELFLLKSQDYSNDQVLGWGVFPLINQDFELNVGNFKVFLHFIHPNT